MLPYRGKPRTAEEANETLSKGKSKGLDRRPQRLERLACLETLGHGGKPRGPERIPDSSRRRGCSVEMGKRRVARLPAWTKENHEGGMKAGLKSIWQARCQGKLISILVPV